MGLFCLVVIVIMLTLMVNLMVDVVDGIGKWIEVFLFVFFGHVGIIFFLFEAHLDGNATSVKVGLTIEVFYGQKGALLVLVVNKRPKLGFFKPNRLNFSKQREDLIESLPACLSRQ